MSLWHRYFRLSHCEYRRAELLRAIGISARNPGLRGLPQRALLAHIFPSLIWLHAGLIIRSVTPANGLVSGGALCRINGSGISNVGTPSCMFGSLRVPATFELTSDVLRCLVPPRDKDGEVAVRVSLNGQQLLPSTVSFRYDHVSPLSSISPSSGLVIGGTSIRVIGVMRSSAQSAHSSMLRSR